MSLTATAVSICVARVLLTCAAAIDDCSRSRPTRTAFFAMTMHSTHPPTPAGLSVARAETFRNDHFAPKHVNPAPG